ncbi:MAG TPA: galactosamine-6-phosphate isomerase [Puia sp.]|nr:galactosamine-6-phosphate isomerase [Puia sp.]
MEIHRHDSSKTLSTEAASLILKKINQKNDAVLCAATGNSPSETYALLKQSFDQQPGFFSNLRIIKLDEWGGIPMDDPGTCESYLQHHLVGPLKIGGDRYISFNSNPDSTVEECRRIQEKLNETGPIDICILGLGMNGHLALNEPGEFLEAHVHVAKLSESSLTHSMIGDMKMKPSYGLTLGMADILQSAFVILIISGSRKKKVTADFLNGNISTKLPASFLWLHHNAVCLIDKEAYL